MSSPSRSPEPATRNNAFVILAQALVLVVVGGYSIASQTDFNAPPRFDGAGYAVLAESLRSGRGYRAIDHPIAPPHAHFPPAYPAALAFLWSFTGPSVAAAHAFSMACTCVAIIGIWIWLRKRLEDRVAFTVAASLALNWTWGRAGGVIQSEPLYLAMVAFTLNIADRNKSRRAGRALVLGFCMGLCVLARHAGVAVVAALLLDMVANRRWRSFFLSAGACLLILVPWFAWLAIIRENTQFGLIPKSALVELFVRQLLFYLQRVPDTLVGPLMEVATVYRPSLRIPATLLAAFLTGIVAFGWCRCAANENLRVAGLLPLITIAVLLLWPFTEAGRFLIPLVPFILVGSCEGISKLLSKMPVGTRLQPPRLAAALLLAVSLPYSVYSIATRRALTSEKLHQDFDRACVWLAQSANQPGPVLVRQSGEAFWLMGRSRSALPPPESGDFQELDALIATHGVAYLVDDETRYSNAPESSLGRFARARANQTKLVRREGSVMVFETIRPEGWPSAKNSD